MPKTSEIQRSYPRVHSKSPSAAASTPEVCLSADPVAWARQALNFIADPKQAEILLCAAARVIVVTSRQVGKSTIAALRALYLALEQANSLILMIL